MISYIWKIIYYPKEICLWLIKSIIVHDNITYEINLKHKRYNEILFPISNTRSHHGNSKTYEKIFSFWGEFFEIHIKNTLLLIRFEVKIHLSKHLFYEFSDEWKKQVL